MGTEASRWTTNDAWILASVACGAGSDLSEVIALADVVNHSIPTPEELGSSLGALIAAGFVEARDGRFQLTTNGVGIRKHWTGGMFGWTSMLPDLEKTERPDATFPMDQSSFDQAFQAYQTRFANALHDLEHRRR